MAIPGKCLLILIRQVCLVKYGVTKPVDFDIDTSGGGLKGRFTIIQTDYKIKPFKAMMGTLKIKDEMDIGFDLALS